MLIVPITARSQDEPEAIVEEARIEQAEGSDDLKEVTEEATEIEERRSDEAALIEDPEAQRRARALAARELAEETSIAITPEGLRQAPEVRGQDLYAEFKATSLTLDGPALTLISRWVTPPAAPRRYDTRFYLAEVSSDPPIRLDETELVSWIWIDPAGALNRIKAGEWSMFNPTIAHLRWLARRSSVDDARRSASGAAGRMLLQPEVMDDGSLVPVALPSDDG